MDRRLLRVYVQLDGERIHPVSRAVITTARALGKNYVTQGVAFGDGVWDLQGLEETGLDECILAEGPGFGQFLPEAQVEFLSNMEESEIFLFPATPEGRTLSSMTAALLHTGVTADCTALDFQEDGRLLQTRPAFSGDRMATIVTRTRPQMASLRFGMAVEEPEKKTPVIRVQVPTAPAYRAIWEDLACQEDRKQKLVLAVGGGLRQKEDLEIFKKLAGSLNCELCCSRVLVDRGWMEKKQQIGLSGRSLRAGTLVTFGISGSQQFLAGLQQVDCLIAVDENPSAPILGRADIPLLGDLYAIAQSMTGVLMGEI